MALTEKQRRIRSEGIGGSEIAAIVGLNPYCTPLQVWARKTRRAEDKEQNEAMVLGSECGPGIVRAYSIVSGLTISRIGQYEQTLVHPELVLARATPDGIIHADGRRSRAIATAEAKFPNPRNFRRWGEPGTDQVPPETHLQITWSVGVARGIYGPSITEGRGLIAGYSLGVYPVPFDQRLFERLYEHAERFWRDYVVADKEPPATTADIKALESLYPEAREGSVEMTDELCDLALDYDDHRSAEKAAALEKNAAGARIRQILGDAKESKRDGVEITWKNNKSKEKTDYQAAFEHLAQYVDEGVHSEVAEQYTETKPGPRVLRVTVKE